MDIDIKETFIFVAKLSLMFAYMMFLIQFLLILVFKYTILTQPITMFSLVFGLSILIYYSVKEFGELSLITVTIMTPFMLFGGLLMYYGLHELDRYSKHQRQN